MLNTVKIVDKITLRQRARRDIELIEAHMKRWGYFFYTSCRFVNHEERDTFVNALQHRCEGVRFNKENFEEKLIALYQSCHAALSDGHMTYGLVKYIVMKTVSEIQAYQQLEISRQKLEISRYKEENRRLTENVETLNRRVYELEGGVEFLKNMMVDMQKQLEVSGIKLSTTPLFESKKRISGYDYEKFDKEIKEELLDPITYELMEDPVIVRSSGITYDRGSLIRYFEHCEKNNLPLTDPQTKKVITEEDLIPNLVVKNMLEHFKKLHVHELEEGSSAEVIELKKTKKKRNITVN